MDRRRTAHWEVFLLGLLPSFAELLGEQLSTLAGCTSQAFTPTSATCSAVSLAVLKPPASLCLICGAAPARRPWLLSHERNSSRSRLAQEHLAASGRECIPLGSGHTHTHPRVLLCAPSTVLPAACVCLRGTRCAVNTALRHQAAGAIATEGLAGEHITVRVEG